MPGLKKAGANWVDGARFFDRETELAVLAKRVHNGTHTLLTAQRRMGKTSLVRELLRRLVAEGRFRTVFVDVEDARTAADAVVEIAVQSRSEQRVWSRIQSWFANIWRKTIDRVDTVSAAELHVKLRAGVDAGNWRQKGDEVLAALADRDRPVVLAIDELPILVNRMLKDDHYRITPEGKRDADEFLSWLRRNGQEHRGGICLIVSGSVSLEPILRQAGLSAHANIFSPLALQPWDEQTALNCLDALAQGCGLDLPLVARRAMCRRLRCLVPHHVQRFFESLDEDLRMAGKRNATEDDVARVYTDEMLGVRGQADLDHYESRLKLVLGPEGYRDALDLLTQAAVRDGVLERAAIDRFRDYFRAREAAAAVPIDDIRVRPSGRGPATGWETAEAVPIDDILRVLEHDGYLEARDDGYRFVSGLLEDWWHARHGQHFIPVEQRATRAGA